MSREPDLRVHPQLDVFRSRGGLFGVAPCDLHADIGRLAVGAGRHCLNDHAVRRAVDVQRIFDGTLAYRTHQRAGDLGRPNRPQELRWIEPGAPLLRLEIQCGPRRLERLPGGIVLDVRSEMTILTEELPAVHAMLAGLAWPLVSQRVVDAPDAP